MRLVEFDPSWPKSVRQSHVYDMLEFGDAADAPGYTAAYRNRLEWTLRLVRQACDPPGRILDVAAAQGNFSLALAENGYRVVWNDIRAELADYVREKYERGEIEFCSGNVFDIAPSVLGLFDVILATEIIEHLAHPDKFLINLSTLLVPGGAIVLTTPNGKYLRNRLPRFSECEDPAAYESQQFGPNADDHIFLLHPDEIVSLAKKAGLSIKRLELFSNPVLNNSCWANCLLKNLPKAVISGIEAAVKLSPSPVSDRLFMHMAVLLVKQKR